MTNLRFDNIPYSDLSDESEWTRLGKGSFGCVYKGEYLGIEVAIKEVLPSGEYDVDKYFQRECKIMAEARHPNIVQYLGLCLAPAAPPSNIFPNRPAPTEQRQRILIISEYLPGGNLRQYIDDTSLPFPWRLRISFAVDCTRAVAYLHSRQCMHRDLKGENVLLSENARMKLADFGFARIAAQNDEEMRRMSYCGTDGYMSPEILMGEEFHLPTDVFSLGVIFCEILSRRLADNHTFARQLPSFGVDLEEVRSLASPNCPPAFIDLALSCLAINPAARPSALSILAALRTIEAQVLEAEARGVGLTSKDERGTWNVGSVSFAGTTKRGGKRPSAPRLPSFEGQVVVGSSMLANGRGQKPPFHARQDSASSESEDDLAMFKLADADVDVDGVVGKDRRTGGESADGLMDSHDEDNRSRYSTAVLGRNRRGHQNIEDASFASSTLTVRAFASGNAKDSTIGHQRLASSASSLPSLPPSWVASTVKQEDSHLDDFPSDVVPSKLQSDAGASYLTARTTTLSIAGATVSHGSDDDEDTAFDDEAEKEERKDVFHSTILPPPGQDAIEIPAPTLHRFSLIKPTFQRFLGSLAPYGSGSSAIQTAAASSSSSLASSVESEKSSKRRSGSATPGMGSTASTANKCGLCSKKLGFMKPFLMCDDCGFHCHIKCSDACPPGCSAIDDLASLGAAPASSPPPAPTRALPIPPPPPLRETSNIPSSSTRPSKLVKKKLAGKA